MHWYKIMYELQVFFSIVGLLLGSCQFKSLLLVGFSVPFRHGERIGFSYLISQKYTGDNAAVRVLRNSEILNFDVKLVTHKRLIPAHNRGRPPSYYIIAGFVFTTVSVPYLRSEVCNSFFHSLYDSSLCMVSLFVWAALYCLMMGHLNQQMAKSLDFATRICILFVSQYLGIDEHPLFRTKYGSNFIEISAGINSQYIGFVYQDSVCFSIFMDWWTCLISEPIMDLIPLNFLLV